MDTLGTSGQSVIWQGINEMWSSAIGEYTNYCLFRLWWRVEWYEVTDVSDICCSSLNPRTSRTHILIDPPTLINRFPFQRPPFLSYIYCIVSIAPLLYLYQTHLPLCLVSWLLFYSSVLSLAYDVQCKVIMNWEINMREGRCVIWGTIPAFGCRDWVKPPNKFIITGLWAKIVARICSMDAPHYNATFSVCRCPVRAQRVGSLYRYSPSRNTCQWFVSRILHLSATMLSL